MTRLAVALPVRNGQNYLAEAIESILAQEFGDFVLAISDNCSTDGTGDIIADYARRDKRVESSRTKRLLPIGANMSRSVTLAPAPWVKLFCHDDLMRGDCLAQIDAAIARWDDGTVSLIGNGESHLLPSGARSAEVIGAEPYRMDGREAARQHMLGSRRYTMPAVTTATVRKASFEAIGGFDQRFEHFDHFCWLRIMAHHDVVFLPDTLTVTRVHEQQITNSSRISLGWMNDYRTFIREYLAENAAQIGLGPLGQLRARTIPVSVAAKSLVMELRTGQLGNFARMLRGVPVPWLPAMPPLLLRSWWVLRRHEQKLFAPSDGRNEQ